MGYNKQSLTLQRQRYVRDRLATAKKRYVKNRPATERRSYVGRCKESVAMEVLRRVVLGIALLSYAEICITVLRKSEVGFSVVRKRKGEAEGS